MYFDPGMGSLIIQALIASLAVVGGYLAATKSRLKNFFTRKRKDVDTENDDADDTL